MEDRERPQTIDVSVYKLYNYSNSILTNRNILGNVLGILRLKCDVFFSFSGKERDYILSCSHMWHGSIQFEDISNLYPDIYSPFAG